MSSRVVNEDFRAPLLLSSAHMQTVRNRVLAARFDPAALSPGRRLLVPTDDDSGDRLVVSLHRTSGTGMASPSRGLVLLVHGLGGSAASVYIQATAVELLRWGFDVARVDLRNAGASKRTSMRTYHAGKTDDLRAVLRVLARQPEATGVHAAPTLAVVGFSLGGAMTLKLLGEPLEGLPIAAGISVSAPLDLVVGAEHLSTAAFGMYERAVVRTLIADAMSPAPDGTSRLSPAERAAVAKVRNLPDFDNVVTAPRHGWRDAHEYYTVNSAAQFLPKISVPTLVIHALDDPMIAPAPYLAVDWESLERSGGVRRAITSHGGHVGFHQSGTPTPWYAGRAVRFLSDHVRAA